MNLKCSVYIASSLDGYIAKTDGDIEWLHNPEYGSMGEGGLSYDAYISGIDALVMGRHSFEKVLTFDLWPYENTPVIVLSSKKIKIPEYLKDKVLVESGEPVEVVKKLVAEGMHHLYIDGGKTIQRFLKDHLIHEITITQIPVLLGDGIPLFGKTGNEIQLKLLESTQFKNGFVQLRYEVLPKLSDMSKQY